MPTLECAVGDPATSQNASSTISPGPPVDTSSCILCSSPSLLMALTLNSAPTGWHSVENSNVGDTGGGFGGRSSTKQSPNDTSAMCSPLLAITCWPSWTIITKFAPSGTGNVPVRSAWPSSGWSTRLLPFWLSSLNRYDTSWASRSLFVIVHSASGCVPETSHLNENVTVNPDASACADEAVIRVNTATSNAQTSASGARRW